MTSGTGRFFDGTTEVFVRYRSRTQNGTSLSSFDHTSGRSMSQYGAYFECFNLIHRSLAQNEIAELSLNETCTII
jgi:hypothetical protein